LLEVARDEGHSGKSLDRPALHGALQRIAAGEAGGLVVAKLDRASRSVVDFGRLLEWFDAADATLVALDLGMDTSTSSGRLVANVMASVAEWERSVIGERTRDALAARKAQGLPISRPSVDGPLAKRIHALRAGGATYQAIADTLNTENVPTLRGAAAWRVSSVQAATGYKRRPSTAPRADLPALPKRRRARASA
jgi:DNA invertase Pin-like site-specific DNA recombinase